jgi:hypothetical protein
MEKDREIVKLCSFTQTAAKVVSTDCLRRKVRLETRTDSL